MAKQLSFNDIVALLAGGRSPELLGVPESATLEFKAEPYRLDLERQRQELAKDLSALANVRGGTLIIGFKTEKLAGRATDHVVEMRPFPKSMFNEDQWRKIAGVWIYPPLDGLQFEWYDDANGKGYVAIDVPEQRQSLRPFVVTRTLSEDDRTDGAVFGMFRRRHADASPLSVQEIHALLRDGLLFRTALDLRAGGAPEPEGKPADVGVAGIPPEIVQATIGRAARLIEIMHLAEQPTYVLTATPYPPLAGRRMFEAADSEIVRTLHKPPEIRSSGFDMDTAIYPDIVAGESRRSFVDGYKGKELWSDGTLIFVARGDDDFLSWGNRDPESPLVINPVTLAESVLLFCELAGKLYAVIGTSPAQIEFAIHLARMCPDSKKKLLLFPGPLGQNRSRFAAKEAPACEFHQRLVAQLPFEPASVAYQLVARVYEWFGHEHDRIPYVDAANGRGIDAKAIGRI